jgi:hypothetical protein
MGNGDLSKSPLQNILMYIWLLPGFIMDRRLLKDLKPIWEKMGKFAFSVGKTMPEG